MTELGLYSLHNIGLAVFGPLVPHRLLVGDFHGLEVMEPYAEDPVIVTTQYINGFVIVSMIGTSSVLQ